MTRYDFIGQRVLSQLPNLEDDLRAAVLEALEVLAVDPENRSGDLTSPIQRYRDPRWGHTYSYVLLGGRAYLVYTVYQDYPKVWLRDLVHI